MTNRALAARTAAMQGTQFWNRRSARRARAALGVMMGGAIALGGCVSVNAPDKPIVIELNINIKQEVIYRLAADAGNTIEENKDIF
ncbi:MAG: YnbE family lipoprotein [Novosphingobium sp.]